MTQPPTAAVTNRGVATPRRWMLLVSLTLILVGCGSTSVGTASPSTVMPTSNEPSASPLPAETGEADAPQGTLTLIPGVEADGPGASVGILIARAPVHMALVNGWRLIDADGTEWLCEALSTSDPPRCGGARLRVEGASPEDLTADWRESGGLHWLPQPAQLFGDVEVP